MLRYAVTIFLSAFLLFQVQPLISKCILPWFGGAPTVWTTCMLFFQVVLLAGYAYAHYVVTRLGRRRQIAAHLVLLSAAAAAVIALPIRPGAAWKPTGIEDPTWRIVALLAVTVGLPYFALATTSPILQAWFARANPGLSPYRLYALSNAGSLLALVSYPFLVEPTLILQSQTIIWSAGLLLFVLVCAYCAVSAGKPKPGLAPPCSPGDTSTPAVQSSIINQQSAISPGLSLRLLWLLLAASGSTMLLAITNQMCQDIAVVPFLWVLPLSLYLLSFIICFDNERWYYRPVLWPLLLASAAGICWVLFESPDVSMLAQVGVYSVGLFASCMVAHGELARLKPDPRHLTSFYLMVSAGGALGGVFVAVIAPLIFPTYLELHVGLWSCCAFGALAAWLGTRQTARRFWHPWGYALTGAILLGLLPGTLTWLALHGSHDCVAVSRNFYGVLRVREDDRAIPERHRFTLLHGGIEHGWQFVANEKRDIPTSYYAEESGLGLALRLYPRASGLRVGAIGLGTGSIAVYGRQGDYFRFYEINREVTRLASSRFTYLADSAAQCEVIVGDARLSLEQELGAPQQFDVLVLDAFNGDAVPVHLLTREAFEIYLRHMKPDGVFAAHITNRHLNLYPVVRGLAEHFGLRLVLTHVREDRKRMLNACTWALIGHDGPFFDLEQVHAAAVALQRGETAPILWTDDYTNLFRILKF